MPIFYVYMKWSRDSDKRSAEFGRYLLTCGSRHAADEFFRALQTLKNEHGKKRYTQLERRTAQFWVYDTIDDCPWRTVLNVLQMSPLSDFRSEIISQILPEGTSSNLWPVIPIVDGPDWINNRTYFVRNKRQTDSYWYHLDGYILVSSAQKTKFRIRGTDFGTDDNNVLIRSDRVEISLVDQDTMDIYLSKEPGTKRLKFSWDSREWKFGDFFGAFGTTWEKRGDIAHEILTWADKDNGDEWELC